MPTDWLPYLHTGITLLSLILAFVMTLRANSIVRNIGQRTDAIEKALGADLFKQSLPVLLHERARRDELNQVKSDMREHQNYVLSRLPRVR